MTMLAWGSRVTVEFRDKIVRGCAALGFDPSWLMACIYFETGGTFDPAIRNAASGATGLIQFMPSTARGLGTTVDALAAMTAVEQLDWVFRYFAPFKGRIRTFADCYCTILWPAAVGDPDDTVLFAAGTSAYAMNAGLDANKDHKVTKVEVAAVVRKRLDQGLLPGNAWEISDTQPAAPIEDRSTTFTPQPEKKMPFMALLAAFGPILAQLIPQIASIVQPKGEVAQRNVALAQVAFDTITKAAGATNVQEAVEKMQGNKELVQEVTAAVISHPEIIGFVEIYPGAVKEAKEAALAMQNADKSFWFNPAFVISGMLWVLPIMLCVDVFFVHPDSYQENLRTQIVTGILAVIMLLGGFWLGSSVGSQRKTEIAAQREIVTS